MYLIYKNTSATHFKDNIFRAPEYPLIVEQITNISHRLITPVVNGRPSNSIDRHLVIIVDGDRKELEMVRRILCI